MKIRGRSLYHLYKEFRDHFLKNMQWNLDMTNGSRKWQNLFALMRFCHIKVLCQKIVCYTKDFVT